MAFKDKGVVHLTAPQRLALRRIVEPLTGQRQVAVTRRKTRR